MGDPPTRRAARCVAAPAPRKLVQLTVAGGSCAVGAIICGTSGRAWPERRRPPSCYPSTPRLLALSPRVSPATRPAGGIVGHDHGGRGAHVPARALRAGDGQFVPSPVAITPPTARFQ